MIAASRRAPKLLPWQARRNAQRYTAPGDLVADPMCGIGTTLAEAVYWHLRRSA